MYLSREGPIIVPSWNLVMGIDSLSVTDATLIVAMILLQYSYGVEILIVIDCFVVSMVNKDAMEATVVIMIAKNCSNL